MNFSLEIGPQTDLDTVPAVKDIYITMLPGGDYKKNWSSLYSNKRCTRS